MMCPKCGGKLKKVKNAKVTINFPDDHFGIKKYTPEQKELHIDIQKLITTKYLHMGADDCMLVFSRVYSTYVLATLKEDGVLEIKPKEKKNDTLP